MPSTQQATPPPIPNPTAGQQVPLGDQCPSCGVLKTFWIFNPLMRHTQQGWVLMRSRFCDCHDRPPAPPPDPDLKALDQLLNREGHRHQTFAAFRGRGHPKCLAAYRFCADYSQRSATAAGVILCGPPTPAREWLLASLVNAARARGTATALISFAHLLELLAPPADAEQFRPARLALRRVPVLAISGLFADPATPVELKPLHQLLEHRGRRARTTHLTLHAPPQRIREQSSDHPIRAEIALLLEQHCLPAIPVPG